LTDAEMPSFQIRYNGCQTTLDSATVIPIAFQVNNGPVVNDTIILMASLTGGEILPFQSDQVVSGLEQMGTNMLRVWTNYDQDPNQFNDTLSFEIQNIFEQNSDFGMTAQPNPGDGCFLQNEIVEVEFGFFGCDSIAAGAELNLFYSLNGRSAVMESFVLPQTIYAFETNTYTFTTPVDLSNSFGTNELLSWVEFGDDLITINDSLDIQLVANPKVMIEEELLTFEAGDLSLDSIYTILSRESNVFTSAVSAATGTMGIQMIGGDVFNNLDELTPPDELTTWTINEIVSAKTCFCVDATVMQDIELSFDLKQTFSPLYLQAFGLDIPRASSLRVLVNDQQVSGTIFPTTYNSDPFVNQNFDLSQLAGTSFEVCIETRNALNVELDPFMIGDNAYIDNIKIGGLSVSTNELPENFNALSLVPNPNNGQFAIAWESQNAGVANVEVFDIFGKRLINQRHQFIRGSNNFDMALERVAAGTYFVRLSDGVQEISKRVVVLD